MAYPPGRSSGGYLSLSGGTLTGDLDLDNNRISNVADPVSGKDAVNLDTVSGIIVGMKWQDPIEDIVNDPPGSPSEGDRYLVGTTPTGVFVTHNDEVATWNGSAWVYEIPEQGWCVSNKTDNYAYNFNGTFWAQLPGATSHSALQNLGADDHSQYVHDSVARTISARHTFSNAIPFTVTSDTMVSNLNAQYLGGAVRADFAEVLHEHGFTDLSDFQIVDLQDGQILKYDANTSKFINVEDARAFSLDPNHQFETATARDVYFGTTNPEELENGLFIAVGEEFQQYNGEINPYDNTNWVSRTAVVRGPAGKDGVNGADGAQGPQGPQGEQGPAGEDGLQGPPGSPGTSVNMQGSVATTDDLPASGNTENDGYYCESDGDCYIWTGSEWVNVGPIVGPQGLQGPRGLQGIQGIQGPIGLTGPQGEIGPVGPVGPVGPRGPSGYDNPYYQEAVEGIMDAPPAVYDHGDRFIVSDTPNGDWVGHNNQIATWIDTDQWYYDTPNIGWAVYDLDQSVHRAWNGTTWVRWESTSGVWGSISGTLANQTDLYNALVGKSSTSHTHGLNDLSNVNLNSLATGDILYYNGSNFVNLSSGASGEYLKSNGVSAPSWADPLGALDVLTYRGAIDCSSNPDYPAADTGDTYKISVDGKIGGASGPSVAVGDLIICSVNSTASGDHATVGSHWSVIGATTEGGVAGPTSSIDGNFPAFSGTSGGSIVDSGTGPSSFLQKTLATAANLFLVSSAANTWAVKTIAEIKTLLGLGGAAYLDVGTEAGSVCAGDDSRLSDSRTPTSHGNEAHSSTFLTEIAWGDITGTLSDQTDLGNVLDGKATRTDSDLTLYVYEDATGTGDGSSKANGFTTLQAAIDAIPDVAQNVTIIVCKGSTNYLGQTTTIQKASVKSLTIQGEFYAYEACDANAVAGKVVDADADFSNFAVGDRVVCTHYSGTVGSSSIDDYFYATITEVGSGYVQTSEGTKIPTTGWRYLINQTVFDLTGETGKKVISNYNSLILTGICIEKCIETNNYAIANYDKLTVLSCISNANHSSLLTYASNNTVFANSAIVNSGSNSALTVTANGGNLYSFNCVFGGDAFASSVGFSQANTVGYILSKYCGFFKLLRAVSTEHALSNNVAISCYIASSCTYGAYGYNITLVDCTNNATTPVYNLTSGGSIEEWDGQALPSIDDATGGQVLALKSDKSGLEFATVSGGGSGITWNEVTGTTQDAAADNGYIANNEALVTVTLPETCAVGKVVRVAGKGAGLWKIAQNESQIIYFGDQNTTSGTAGYLAAQNQYDSIELLCITANTTFNVISVVGNITVI